MDYTINLTNNKSLRPYIYSFSRLKALAVKEYINKILSKKFI